MSVPEPADEPRAARPPFRPHEFGRGNAAWMSRTVSNLAESIHPLLATIPTVTIADPPAPEEGSDVQELEDAHLKSPLYRGAVISHEWVAHLDESLNFDVDACLAQLYEMADSYGAQMMRGLIELISDTCDSTGNVIDAKDIGFFDAMIRAVETMEMSFDEDGNHNTTLLVHPDTAKKLAELTPTPEQQASMDAVLAKKRSDWDASRSRRDLPGLPDGT